MTTKLTPQQEELMISYQQKWRAISLSTARIDRSRVFALLEDVFRAFPESPTMPEVMFFESPYAAFNAELIISTLNFNELSDDEVINEVASLQTLRGDGLVRSDLWFELDSDIDSTNANPHVNFKVWEVLRRNLVDNIGSRIYDQLWEVLENWLTERLLSELKDASNAFRCFFNNFISPDSEWASYGGLFDFCIHELGCQHDQEQWDLYQAMCSKCSYWFLPTPTHYIICERPTILLLDNDDKLHADGVPAIQFSDGFGLYAKHGEISSICFP